MSIETPSKGTILIVDDTPANVSVLFDFLAENGYKVLVAQEGKRAIQKAEYGLPDLILLDVMMPGIDGFETCRRLKSNPKTQDIPIIFMTALSDSPNKIKGFELGAVDYVTKPFQQEEVLARINTHLTIRYLQKNLQVKNAELADKNRELNAFTRTVAHDLKTPVTNLISLSELLLEEHSGGLHAQALQSLQHILKSGENMLSLIRALQLLERVSSQEITLAPVDMGYIVVQVKQRLFQMFKQYQGELILPQNWPMVQCYAPWVEEIWANYLTNGLKYGGRPPRLELGSTPCEDMIRFWVRDNGHGLNAEAQSQLFTPFSWVTHKRSEDGHGLGLYVARRIVNRMGGEVGVESKEGGGSLFYFTLMASR